MNYMLSVFNRILSRMLLPELGGGFGTGGVGGGGGGGGGAVDYLESPLWAFVLPHRSLYDVSGTVISVSTWIITIF